MTGDALILHLENLGRICNHYQLESEQTRTGQKVYYEFREFEEYKEEIASDKMPEARVSQAPSTMTC